MYEETRVYTGRGDAGVKTEPLGGGEARGGRGREAAQSGEGIGAGERDRGDRGGRDAVETRGGAGDGGGEGVAVGREAGGGGQLVLLLFDRVVAELVVAADAGGEDWRGALVELL